MNSIVSEKRYISERLGLPYESLSQSYLRSETQLSSQSVIDFVVQSNKKQNKTVTERLLNLNDEFVITHFSCYLKATLDSIDTEQAQAPAFTYVPVGPTSPFTGNSTNAVAIYNSDLSFTIDRKEFVPQFPVRSFFRVPQTQNDPAAVLDAGFDNSLYGFFPSEPTKINGRQTIDLSINLGSTVDMTPTGGPVYAVFEARGYLITNANN